MSGYRIGQWARYGLIRPTVFKGRPANLYAFYDVAEAIVVHWLLEQNFDHAGIHAAVERAEREYPRWPLINAPLGVAKHATAGDTRGRIALEVERGVFVDTSTGADQVLLRPELLEEARLMLQRGGWLADHLRLGRLEVDPQKLGGAPTLRGRRWPVERVAQLAADEEGQGILLQDYGLDERDIDESLRWVDAASRL